MSSNNNGAGVVSCVDVQRSPELPLIIPHRYYYKQSSLLSHQSTMSSLRLAMKLSLESASPPAPINSTSDNSATQPPAPAPGPVNTASDNIAKPKPTKENIIMGSSLRLAMKLSLDPSTPSDPINSTSDISSAKPPKVKVKRRLTPVKIPLVELPKIDKCIRNEDPTMIDQFGFVEITRTISNCLVQEIYQEASDKVTRHETGMESSSSPTSVANTAKRQKPSSEVEVEEISNALQTDVSDELREKIATAIHGSPTVGGAMKAVFGQMGPSNIEPNYKGQFVLETPKVLITKPGSNPQLPHADDHCTSCLICLVHLCDKQEPTRIAKYDGNKDYATGITVRCDKCDRHEQLPDCDFRRGVHLTDEAWHCSDCKSQHVAYDFEGKLVTSFTELIETNAPNLCDSYAGKKNIQAGDGVLCLPTLIHRGPGNPTSAKKSRYMLFLTLRPKYNNMKSEGIDLVHHRYNPFLQIHAPCILYNQFKKVKTMYERSGFSLDGHLGALYNSDVASAKKETTQSNKKNKNLSDNEVFAPARPFHGACVGCHKSKCKCSFAKSSLKCDRCYDMNKECVPRARV
jgi:hypothetical protein